MDWLEIVIECSEDSLQVVVISASVEFGNHGHKKGNLEADLVAIGAIKNAV